MSSGDRRTLRLGGLVIVSVCIHKFGDLSMNFYIRLYELLCYDFLCKVYMNHYVMISCAKFRLTVCSVPHAIAN